MILKIQIIITTTDTFHCYNRFALRGFGFIDMKNALRFTAIGAFEVGKFIIEGDNAFCQAGFGGEEPVVLGFELADGGVKSFFGSDFSFKVSHGK